MEPNSPISFILNNVGILSPFVCLLNFIAQLIFNMEMKQCNIVYWHPLPCQQNWKTWQAWLLWLHAIRGFQGWPVEGKDSERPIVSHPSWVYKGRPNTCSENTTMKKTTCLSWRYWDSVATKPSFSILLLHFLKPLLYPPHGTWKACLRLPCWSAGQDRINKVNSLAIHPLGTTIHIIAMPRISGYIFLMIWESIYVTILHTPQVLDSRGFNIDFRAQSELDSNAASAADGLHELG